MEPTDPVQAVVAVLRQARRAQRPVPAAPLERLLSVPEDAYGVQERMAREGGWFADGVARHWKSGGASRPAVLTHAPLPDAGVWPSPARASDFHFNLHQVEAEIALRLARDVTPADAAALTPELAPGLVDAMCVSIEMVDSRWAEAGKAAALLKLADLQSHGALVLGEWKRFEVRDWARQTCEVTIGKAAPQKFQGTHSLADPCWLLPTWLRHVTRHGATVPRGTVVTTGTWCGLLTAHQGDHVKVVFEGIGGAEIQL